MKSNVNSPQLLIPQQGYVGQADGNTAGSDKKLRTFLLF